MWLAREHRSLYRNDAVADGWSPGRAARPTGPATAERMGGSGWRRPKGPSTSNVRSISCEARFRWHGSTTTPTSRPWRWPVGGRWRSRLAPSNSVRPDIDEAMAAATAGEGLDPRTIGEACCALMEVAALLGDGERVGSWAGAVDRFRGSYVWRMPIPVFDPAVEAHQRLVELAKRGENVVVVLQLPPMRFEAQRRYAGEQLARAGVTDELNEAVAAVLS